MKIYIVSEAIDVTNELKMEKVKLSKHLKIYINDDGSVKSCEPISIE